MINWFDNKFLKEDIDNRKSEETMMTFGDSYEMSINCLKLKPKTLFEFNLLTKSEFDIYVFKLFFKSIVCIRKNKAILETANLNSIIKFDIKKNDGRVEASIWSKNGKIFPNFFLKSNSTEKSLKIMIDILSSLKFNLDELPDQEVFEKKLGEAIQLYEQKEPLIENQSK